MIGFEDIAMGKNLDMDELLTQIESIVSSGMKLNIDYYIEEAIDPDHQEEILDYFATAESDSVDDALEELGEDEYSMEEIRIMHCDSASAMASFGSIPASMQAFRV